MSEKDKSYLHVEDFKALVIKNGVYILSDGTLNMDHLLSKAHDVIKEFHMANENPQLIVNIYKVFSCDKEDLNAIYEHGLFFAQYYNMCKIKDELITEADYIWNEDIYNLFQSVSPDGYYFGSSDGDGACIGWFKCESEEEEEETMRKPITNNPYRYPVGYWTCTNTSSVNVWEFSPCNDGILVGINDDEPEWCEIQYKTLNEIEDVSEMEIDDNIEDELIACIRFNGTWFRLDECMKISKE